MNIIAWIKEKLSRPHKTNKKETKRVIDLKEKYEKWATKDKLK